ncbi:MULTISPECIES: Tar ligand binding domain-containing protein [unclassified Pseudomonas]|uniref:Tar ligand binding domain-containing protein n=1 Tax=unclassified Pseudomonas TaxID=196821 RepID=UPI001CC04F9F|nr:MULTISPECIES: Tar ligand binding domain-containing protein [unclassified Pseudomonas]
MFKTITIAQRLWLWALLVTLLFVLAVGFGGYGLQQARDSLRAINEDNLATLLMFGEVQHRLDESRRQVLLAIQQDPEGPLVAAFDRPVEATLSAMVDGMGRVVSRVRDGVSLAHEAGDSVAQIRSGTDDVIRSVDTIATVITEQERVTREMVARVESVSAGTGALSANAGRSAVVASDLEQLARALDQLSARFNVV